MKTIVVIHLPQGSEISPNIQDFLGTVPDCGPIYLLNSSDLPGPWENHPLPQTPGELLEFFLKFSQGKDNIIYFYGDCPFLRKDVFEQMWESHGKYRAQYSFSDGMPYGLAVEILKAEIIPSLILLIQKKPDLKLSRQSIFEVISQDINAFDIETHLSPLDLRALRLSFTLDTRRNKLLIERYKDFVALPLKEFLTHLETHQKPQRTLPAYFLIQTVTKAKNLGFYDPRVAFPEDFKKAPDFMPRKDFKILMDKIQEFSGDGVINPSLWGDPVFHPDFPGIVEEVCSRAGWSLVLETPLVGWDKQVWEKCQTKAKGKLTWIVEMDSWDAKSYEKIRGDGYHEVFQAVQDLQQLFPGQVYVQTVRMNETEDQMESFYKGWKKLGIPVIIQKYDNLAGQLPDRKVNDISPLRRGVCWHLKRDMSIFIDGTVPLCRTDFRARFPQGNAFTESLDLIWSRGEVIHEQHLKGDFGPFCGKCDEFYTYNF